MLQHQTVLQALLDLELEQEFSLDLESEIRTLYISVVTTIDKYKALYCSLLKI